MSAYVVFIHIRTRGWIIDPSTSVNSWAVWSVEAVYGWPGIGQLAWQAIQEVDVPIIMGVTLVSSLAIVLANLLADLIAPLLDPRIRVR